MSDILGKRAFSPAEALNGDLGLSGFEVITGATGSTGYVRIVPIGGAATFSATTQDHSADFPSTSVSEGVEIKGPFKDVTVTTGTVLAYKA